MNLIQFQGNGRMREDRKSGFVSIALRNASFGDFKGILKNISLTGAAIKTQQRVPVGTYLEFRLGAGIWLTAFVRWLRDGQIGIEFDEPISEQEAREAIQPRPVAAPVLPIYAESLIAHCKTIRPITPNSATRH